MNQILPDIQNDVPDIKVAVDKVGIDDLIFPIYVRNKSNDTFQHSIAKVSCFINLSADRKGINMSRIPIELQKHISKPLSKDVIEEICIEIKKISKCETCDLEYEFEYFTSKSSPVVGLAGLVNSKVRFIGHMSKDNVFNFRIYVKVLTTSCCPCSREISDNGAHNQKCYIEFEVLCNQNGFIWIEDLIKIADRSASCEIFSVLKRPDEKFVTEKMYNNAKFVEDVIRSCYVNLETVSEIDEFKIRVTSDESIHIHNAIASIGY